MRGPTRSDLPELQTTDPEVFKRFLVSGFRGDIEENKGRHAFGAAAPFMGRNGSFALDLEDVHDCLEAAEQMAFREGCVRALEDVVHCDPSSREAVAVNLIVLAGRVRASRMLEVLANIVRVVAHEIKDDSRREELYRSAFDAAVTAATPTAQAKACLLNLCAQRAMPPRLAPVALLRLIEADPDGVASHLNALWTQIDSAIGWAPETGDAAADAEQEGWRAEARKSLVTEVFGRVPVGSFIETLAPEPRMATSPGNFPADWQIFSDWWSRSLHVLPHILIACAAYEKVVLPSSIVVDECKPNTGNQDASKLGSMFFDPFAASREAYQLYLKVMRGAFSYLSPERSR